MRAQHDDEIEEAERLRIGPERAEPAARRRVQRHRRHASQKERDDGEAGKCQERRPRQPETLGKRREHQRAEREAERAARDVHGHRQPRPVTAEPMGEGRRRRMERRRAESADDQDHREHHRRGRDADEAEHRHRDDRTDHDEEPRTPPVGQTAEANLRHRSGHLKAHRQQPRREEREAQLRDEERQQRGVDVPVAIDHDMGAGHQQDSRVQFEARHVSGGPGGE